jgi:predicted phage terminase large subunit-like protein
MNPEEQSIIDAMIADPAVRQRVAPASFAWFFPTYFSHYLKYETAPFHKEMIRVAESDTIRLAVIMAFRGSAKSTIFSLAYPIWSIIGRQQRKFVLILTETKDQARILMANLRNEMEYNEMLKRELGPFEDGEQWGAMSVVIPKYRARIMVASSEQAVRGIRHWENRPDLIIVDDIQTVDSVKSMEQRDKDYQWFTGEIIPVGDLGTKIVLIGNMLHQDSLLMRLAQEIKEGQRLGVVHYYPLVDEHDCILWTSKFPNMEAVEALRKTVVDDITWHREYLLNLLSASEQVIKPEWIVHYETDNPPVFEKFRYFATGIDPAISLKDMSDMTAMVSARVYGFGKKLRVVVLPYPVNEHLDFPRTLEKAKWLSDSIGKDEKPKLFVEHVAYQQSLTQQLVEDGYKAEGVELGGADKRTRLSLISALIQSGQVLFPKRGAEALIAQLTGFGAERHDDLADALVILLLKVMEDKKPSYDGPFPINISTKGFYDRGGHIGEDWADREDRKMLGGVNPRGHWTRLIG